VSARPSTPAAVDRPAVVMVHDDLPYQTLEDGTTTALDLAYPEGPGPHPCVLLIHGGGWMTGSRKSNRPLMLELASRGYVAVSVGYRLAPEHRFPAQLHDVQNAVRWLRAHAGRYRLDPDRIAAVGYSAGGTLACLLGTPDLPADFIAAGPHADQPWQVQAVVSVAGIADLEWLHRSCLAGELPRFENSLVKFALENGLAVTRERASPIAHAGRRSSATLLVHGTADQFVPLAQSRLLEERLRAAGADVALVEVPGAPHIMVGEHEKKVNAALRTFLDQKLRRSELFTHAR